MRPVYRGLIWLKSREACLAGAKVRTGGVEE